MALPWLIGGAIALGIGALVASGSDNNDNHNDDDEEEEQRRRKAREKAKKEREAKARQEEKANLEKDFEQRCLSAQVEIAQTLKPYFEVEFHGDVVPIEKPASVKKRIAFLTENYHVHIAVSEKLKLILEEIDGLENDWLAAKELQRTIQNSLDNRG
jgi:DNA repair photolyase